MIAIPAIDLLGGRVVRLREGRREEASIYHDDAMEVARRWVAAGAQELHIVDLDAAFGDTSQRKLIATIIAGAGVPVQVGGGVRDEAAATALLGAGAARVVLGTAAIKQPAIAERLCRRHPGAIVVAVDAREGRVAVEGWTEVTEMDAGELGQRAAQWGAGRILYTDIARDGGKEGPNVTATARLQAKLGATPVIASGGIGSLDDLRELSSAGIPYCVIGRALYDGVFTLEEAIQAC